MDEVTPKAAFEAFVIDNVGELRRAARLIGGDDATAAVLLDRALADTATRWASIGSGDPTRFALEALDSAATATWDRDIDDDPSHAETTIALAARAWTSGRRRRRRRRRAVLTALLVVVAIVTAYVVSMSIDRPPPADTNLSADRMYPLPDDRFLLPPPVLIRDTPTAENPLDGLADAPIPLTSAPLMSFAGAVQWEDGSISVVSADGEHRTVDSVPEPPVRALAERAIAPGGQWLALRNGADVVIVGVDGSVSTVAAPVDDVIDVLWSGDASAIIVTGIDGSVNIDLETGDETTLGFIGTNVVTTPGTTQVRELTAPNVDAPMVRIHGGTVPRREIPFAIAGPWAASWTGPPAIDANGSTMARACLPDPRVEVPATFGTPIGCVAVIDVSGRVEALLVLTNAHPPVSPTLLGVQNGRIVLAVGDDAAPKQRIMRWDPATGDVVILAHIAANATVVITPTPGR